MWICDLYQVSFRFYDSKIARFLSPDSLVPGVSQSQSFNRYAYVFNNPLKFSDPSGHVPKNTSHESWFSLASEVSDEVDREYLFNMRVDFDAQGNTISDSSYPVVVDESGKVVGGGHVAQGASLGLRQSLRLGLAPLTSEGTPAQMALLTETTLRRGYERTVRVFNQTYLSSSVEFLDNAQDYQLRQLTAISPPDIEGMGFRLGLKTGLGQTPLITELQENIFSIAQEQRHGYVRVGYVFGSAGISGLGFTGGAFGAYSALQSDSLVVNTLGGLGGLMEGYGAVKLYRASRFTSPSFLMTSGASSAGIGVRGLGALRYMKWGGIAGLLATAIEITYLGGGFDQPLPSYTREEAIQMRLEAQGVSHDKKDPDPSHPFGGATR